MKNLQEQFPSSYWRRKQKIQFIRLMTHSDVSLITIQIIRIVQNLIEHEHYLVAEEVVRSGLREHLTRDQMR